MWTFGWINCINLTNLNTEEEINLVQRVQCIESYQHGKSLRFVNHFEVTRITEKQTKKKLSDDPTRRKLPRDLTEERDTPSQINLFYVVDQSSIFIMHCERKHYVRFQEKIKIW